MRREQHVLDHNMLKSIKADLSVTRVHGGTSAELLQLQWIGRIVRATIAYLAGPGSAAAAFLLGLAGITNESCSKLI